MITFLTSSPTKEITPECPLPALYGDNGFVDLLGKCWPAPGRCLMIAAFPDAHERNDEMTDFYRRAVENAGLPVSRFDLWDHRAGVLTREELGRYDVIFLAGGHVPTEAAWFASIGLREKLAGFGGVVVGTSAGSMNAAEEVYAWPEEPEETEKPVEELFFPGLGLARTLVLPHLQKLRDSRLDGQLLVEDIACSHSYGHSFLAIPDGSFVLAAEGEERVYGEAWLVSEGQVRPFCRAGESRSCP